MEGEGERDSNAGAISEVLLHGTTERSEVGGHDGERDGVEHTRGGHEGLLPNERARNKIRTKTKRTGNEKKSS